MTELAPTGADGMIVCDRLVRIYSGEGIEVQALQGLDLLIAEGETTFASEGRIAWTVEATARSDERSPRRVCEGTKKVRDFGIAITYVSG